MKASRKCLLEVDSLRRQSPCRSLMALAVAIFCIFVFLRLSMAMPNEVEKTPQIKTHGQLPLYFVKNEGQFDERVKYYEKASGHTIFFAEEEIVFSFEKAASGLAGIHEVRLQQRTRRGFQDETP